MSLVTAADTRQSGGYSACARVYRGWPAVNLPSGRNARRRKAKPMTMRRLIIGVGAVLLLAGIIGLLAPVSVSDSNGHSVGCGNAVATDLSAAQSANNSNGANIPILNQIV